MKNLENILSHSSCLSQEQMQLYLDQKLDQEQMHAVERHFTDCLFCSDALEGLQSIDAHAVENQVDEIRSHIESLLQVEEDEATPAHTKIEESVEPLRPVQGGRRISWKAAAGLFFIIFAGGLVVFSYVKDNTTWFDDKHPQYSKNEPSKELDDTESTLATPELESLTIDANDLARAQEVPLEPKRKTKKVSKKNEHKLAKKEEVVAKNQQTATTNTLSGVLAPPPVYQNKELQSETEKYSPAVKSDLALEKAKTNGKDKSKEVIAKLDNNLSTGDDNLHLSNTYTQPRYEGKLEDIKKIGRPNNEIVKLKQKNEQVTLSDQRSNENRDMIDAIQSKGYKKSTYYDAKLDNFAKGNQAYNKGDYKQSIKFYKRALRKKNLKNRDEVLYQLAMAYEKTNNQSKAEPIYEELEKKAPFQSRALNGLRRVRSVK